MVGALASLLDQPDLSLGVTCCEANALPQIFLRDRMGAGARHQKPFRLQQLQAQEIDIFIASQGTSQGLLATSEGRRIEDHQIIAPPGLDQLAHLLECIGLAIDAAILHLVHRRVRSGHGQCIETDIEALH